MRNEFGCLHCLCVCLLRRPIICYPVWDPTYSEIMTLRLSGALAGRTTWYCRICSIFQISSVQDTSLYPACCETLPFSQFQLRMLMTLPRALLVLLSISNIQTGEPIPVASAENVQLLKVKCSEGTPTLLLGTPDLTPCLLSSASWGTIQKHQCVIPVQVCCWGTAHSPLPPQDQLTAATPGPAGVCTIIVPEELLMTAIN